MATHRIVYIWEAPVRIAHWINVVSIFVLAITGFYIGSPFIHSLYPEALTMAWFRNIHFIAARLLTLGVLIRIYWFYAGNDYAKFDQFVPMNERRWENVLEVIRYYIFLRRGMPRTRGHTGLAGLAYTACLGMILIEIVTGFALYYQGHPSFASRLMGGWALAFMSSVWLRVIHHAVMWGISLFFVAHLYIGVHNDIIEKDGIMSSIFSGYKVFGVWKE